MARTSGRGGWGCARSNTLGFLLRLSAIIFIHTTMTGGLVKYSNGMVFCILYYQARLESLLSLNVW